MPEIAAKAVPSPSAPESVSLGACLVIFQRAKTFERKERSLDRPPSHFLNHVFATFWLLRYSRS